MSGQDFNTVTFGSKPVGGSTKKPGGGSGGSTTSTGMSAAKLDAETEELKRECRLNSATCVITLTGVRSLERDVADNTVDKDLRLAIMKGRAAKGLTQVCKPFVLSFPQLRAHTDISFPCPHPCAQKQLAQVMVTPPGHVLWQFVF